MGIYSDRDIVLDNLISEDLSEEEAAPAFEEPTSLEEISIEDSLGINIDTPEESDIESNKILSSGIAGTTSDTEERALELLGTGIQPEQVAAALGVTPARISQLLSDDEFAKRVAIARYNTLQSHNKRDNAYDELEDKVIEKLKKSLGLIFKPMELVKVMTAVNAAKRRGQSAPQQVTNQNNIINLTIPKVVINKFATNIDNQVISAGKQELLTMTSNNLLSQIEARRDAELIESEVMENTNVQEERS